MQAWFWAGVLAFIFAMLWLDLRVLNRQEHVVSTREALAWTAIWVSAALLFAIPIYFIYEHHWLGFGIGATGRESAVRYLSGWATEYSLSLDNIFVIALIFDHFSVPPIRRHRVLVWGILGALALRGGMIALGAVLLHRFQWIMYIFGALLVASAARMALMGERKIDPGKNPLVRLTRRVVPVSPGFDGGHFFVRQDGRLMATPLLVVLLVVEATDLVFAVDSIPAIFGITQDPFLVFTSNAFAILGLRSLFFALAGLVEQFRYIKVGLIVILAFIGVKMLGSGYVSLPDEASLAIIVGIIAVSVVASLAIKFPGHAGE